MTFCQKELPTPCQFIHYKVISIFFTGVFCVGCDVRCCMLSEQRKKSQHSLVYDALGRGPPQCKTFKWFTHFYQGCKSHSIITTLTFQPLQWCMLHMAVNYMYTCLQLLLIASLNIFFLWIDFLINFQIFYVCIYYL